MAIKRFAITIIAVLGNLDMSKLDEFVAYLLDITEYFLSNEVQ